jgi:peptidyl-prolyl cis-trans isomerase B (cyclophilin B)
MTHCLLSLVLTTGALIHVPLAQDAAQSKPTSQPAKAPTTDAAMTTIDQFIQEKKIDTKAEGWKTRLPMPPKADFPKDKKYFWNMTTNKGSIKIRLMQEVAPMHVSSTIYLTKLGFYDGVVFHRVIPGFMAQGGDPTGTGRGSAGYSYDGETRPDVKHDRPGLLSMANTGMPKTDGSQFFLTFVPTPHLNNKHTIFGEVVEGMETVRALEKCGTQGGQTTERLLIEKATITVE